MESNHDTNQTIVQTPQSFQEQVVHVPDLSTGAKVGYFFLAWLPLLASIILQFVGAFIIMLPMALYDVFTSGVDPQNYDAVMEVIFESIIESASAGVVFYHILGILVFGLWYYFSFKKPRPKVMHSVKALNGRNILVSVIAGIGLVFFANGTVVVESFVLPQMVQDYIEAAEIAGLGISPLVIFTAIILAPIGEELLCRGIILKYFRKSLPYFWLANCLQALTFGIIHMNFVQGIYAFACGLLMGWLVKRYDSILPAIIVHFVLNFSSSTWVAYALAPLPESIWSGVVLLAVSVPIIVAALLLTKKKKTQQRIV